MRLWIDDVRPAPDGYIWVKSVETARIKIRVAEIEGFIVEAYQ